MRLNIDYIDKTDFFELYCKTRSKAFKKDIICSGFKTTGLMPYNLSQMLTKLYINIKTFISPNNSYSSRSL